MNKGIILRVFGNVKMLLICPNEYIDGTIILALMSDKDTTVSKLANESCMILEGFAGTDSSKCLYLKC